MVYQNGESSRRWVHIWAESLDEILAQATERLGLPRHAKLIYDENRERVTSFEALERDSLLCITTGDTLKGRCKHISSQFPDMYYHPYLASFSQSATWI